MLLIDSQTCSFVCTPLLKLLWPYELKAVDDLHQQTILTKKTRMVVSYVFWKHYQTIINSRYRNCMREEESIIGVLRRVTIFANANPRFISLATVKKT